MRPIINVSIESNELYMIAYTLWKVHSDYYIKANNEIADILEKISQDKIMILRTDPSAYFSNNITRFKNLEKLVNLLNNIQRSFIKTRDAYEKTTGEKFGYGIHEASDNPRNQEMLNEISRLIQFKFDFRLE
jgi:hypothetical protein